VDRLRKCHAELYAGGKQSLNGTIEALLDRALKVKGY